MERMFGFERISLSDSSFGVFFFPVCIYSYDLMMNR